MAVIQELRNRLQPSDLSAAVAVKALKQIRYMPRQGAPDAELWASIYSQYAADLSEFPPTHIVEAVTIMRRTKTFFPSVAELRACCAELVDHDRRHLRRAEYSLTGNDGRPKTAKPYSEEEDTLEVRRGRAMALSAIMEKFPAPAPKPSPSPPREETSETHKDLVNHLKKKLSP